MKSALVQNQSEDVIRQNHQLKNEVVQLNQKINNYQQQMTEVIATLCPSTLIFATPLQIFRNFISIFKLQIKNHQITKRQNQRYRGTCQKLQNESENVKVQVQLKMKELQVRINEWTNQRERLNKDILSQRQQFKKLKKETDQIKRQFNQLKIEKLKLKEQRNRQIEQIILSHHLQQIDIKTLLQTENLTIQKKLKAEIQSKNVIIKQMTNIIQNIKAFQNNQSEDADQIQQMIKRLKKFNDLSQIVTDVRSQNTELRLEKYHLYNSKTKLQTKIKQLKYVQSNLISQLQRFKIYQEQLQENLLAKSNQLFKSQKEKEEMEKYYTGRWNTQYKRVKNQVERDAFKKITKQQQQYNQRIVQLQLSLKKKIQQKQFLEERNIFLEDIHINNQNIINELRENIENLEEKIKQLQINVKQVQLMNYEDILMNRFNLNQQKIAYKKNLSQLNKIIKHLKEQIVNLKHQYKLKIQQLQQKFLFQFQKQKHQHQNDKIMLKSTHQEEIHKIMKEIQLKQKFVLQMQIQFKLNYQNKLKHKEVQFMQKLADKEQEYRRKQEKWIDKFQQQQVLSLMAKKKFEQELAKIRIQIDSQQQKNRRLLQSQKQIKIKNQEVIKQNKLHRQKILNLQKQVKEKKLLVSEFELKNQKITQQLGSSQSEVNSLLQLRKQWQNQLTNLQIQLKQEFNQLKRQNQIQRKFIKQKIIQLQGMYNKKMIIQKDYEQFNLINQQKEKLAEEIHNKQAQNFLLTQAKDFYKIKLKEAQQQISKKELNGTHSIMTRKVKKDRLRQDRQYCSSQKALDQLAQSKQMGKTKRYTIYSYRKNFNFSTSKQKLEQSTNSKHLRLKTSYAS